MTHKTTIEIEIEVDFEVSPYYPARTYGPPEDCCPEEGGEVEICYVDYNGKAIELSDADMDKIQKEIEKSVADGNYNPEPQEPDISSFGYD